MKSSQSTSNIIIRPSNQRGHADHGWLKSYHTFSFADFHDPKFTGFRSLRVINEDTVEPGRGFEAHQHRDMEIISYVLEGQLEHKDSMGNGSLIKEGYFQRMSAGSGVRHSEFNASKKNSVHFLQIWIEPDTKGGEPSYQELRTDDLNRFGLTLIASNKSEGDILMIRQDARLYLGRLPGTALVDYDIAFNRGIWIYMIRGRLKINGRTIQNGDSLAVEEANHINLRAGKDSMFLLFDLA